MDSLDTFIRRLRLHRNEGEMNGKGKGKGKGKEKEKEGAVSIVITKAERLPRIMGSGWAVMTRLAELVSLYFTIERKRLINRLESLSLWSWYRVYHGTNSVQCGEILLNQSTSTSHPLLVKVSHHHPL